LITPKIEGAAKLGFLFSYLPDRGGLQVEAFRISGSNMKLKYRNDFEEDYSVMGRH